MKTGIDYWKCGLCGKISLERLDGIGCGCGALHWQGTRTTEKPKRKMMQTIITVNNGSVAVRCATCESEILAKRDLPMVWDCECSETHLEITGVADSGPTGEDILAMDKDEREADQLIAKLRRAMGKDWRFRVRQSVVDGKWIAEVADRKSGILWGSSWRDWMGLNEDGLPLTRAARWDSRLAAVNSVKAFCMIHGL